MFKYSILHRRWLPLVAFVICLSVSLSAEVVPVPKIHPPASIQDDLRPISLLPTFAKVLDWLGHQTCKNRRPYNLYCVGADVKPCSINLPIWQTILALYLSGLLITTHSWTHLKPKKWSSATQIPLPSLLSQGDAENAGLEYAGLENTAPNCRGGICRTGKYGTNLEQEK